MSRCLGKIFQVIFTQIRIKQAFQKTEKIKFVLYRLVEYKLRHPVMFMRNKGMEAEDQPRQVDRYEPEYFNIAKIIRNREKGDRR